MRFQRIREYWYRLRPGDHQERFVETLAPATWCLDWARLDGTRLSFAGWVIRTRAEPVAFTLNGRPVEALTLGQPRPDVASIYRFVPSAAVSGFSAVAPIECSEARGDMPIQIECVDPADNKPLRFEQACYVPVPTTDPWPLPDDIRMRRVHGSADVESFRILGYSNYRKLDRALGRAAGHGLDSCAHILDWGCGCGRLLRHFGRLSRPAITGVDVDRDNIAWCRARLPFADYHTIPLHPPSNLPDATFDCIVGISVFTHLDERVQEEWLAELRRIARPGAILMMSIHGPAATASRNSVPLWKDVIRLGFADGRSPVLRDVLAERGYYRNSFHSHAYVRKAWGRYFEIVEIVPACIGNVQDLVVMRARSK